MKIVHLITSLGFGGAERQLKALVDTSEPSMHHVVISLQDEGPVGKQLLKNKKVSLHCLNLHQSSKGLWQLYQILRRENPDILQTWLYHADLVGLIMGKLARVPRIVWNIRCSNMDLSLYPMRTRFIVRLLTLLSRFPDAVISNSKAGQDFHTALGYRPRRWIWIPNGIDTDYFHPNESAGKKLRHRLKIPEDAVVVGMLARVDPMKDHGTFLKAMATLLPNHENYYCLLAGKDTDTTRWDVSLPRFYTLGALENAPEFLNALDIMVLSSAFGEGFPNVVGEAMACGIPTITSDVGDAALLSQSVPPGNAKTLAAALGKLLRLSHTQRKALGQKGRDKIMKSYSLSLMRQRYRALYEEARRDV